MSAECFGLTRTVKAFGSEWFPLRNQGVLSHVIFLICEDRHYDDPAHGLRHTRWFVRLLDSEPNIFRETIEKILGNQPKIIPDEWLKKLWDMALRAGHVAHRYRVKPHKPEQRLRSAIAKRLFLPDVPCSGR